MTEEHRENTVNDYGQKSPRETSCSRNPICAPRRSPLNAHTTSAAAARLSRAAAEAVQEMIPPRVVTDTNVTETELLEASERSKIILYSGT